MKNLQEREDSCLLTCPLSMAGNNFCLCLGARCARFLPDEKECSDVLAARAQVRAAEALEAIASSVHTDSGGARYLRIKTGNAID